MKDKINIKKVKRIINYNKRICLIRINSILNGYKNVKMQNAEMKLFLYAINYSKMKRKFCL